MPVTTNFQSSRIGKKQREQVIQALTPLFTYRSGKWHVQFIGNGDDIEMRVSGPGVETSELVDAKLDPATVAEALRRVLEG